MSRLWLGLLIMQLALVVHSAEPDWAEGFSVPLEGRSNPYQVDPQELDEVVRRGRIHMLNWPVEITGVVLPYHPIKKMLDERDSNPIRRVFQSLFRGISGLRSFDQVMEWLGLHEFPETEDVFPFPEGFRPEYRMGMGLIERHGAEGFTFSCASCHAADLFGTKVLGLSNRFPLANDFFVKGSAALRTVPELGIRLFTDSTDAEVEMLTMAKDRIQHIEAKAPIQLGLDTSLAQVALSLSKRNQDAYASFNEGLARNPRHDRLRRRVADSKPAVWWTLKYKNKFLLDGSVVSGNPIFTNLLWNEIGRGTDLRELEDWLVQNTEIVRELTTAVFTSEAPSITDFFPAEHFDLESAKRGEVLFQQTCAECHGQYKKNWSLPGAENMSLAQQLKTFEVQYFQDTPISDVGTDPYRYWGMESLEQLNNLEISKKNGILIRQQTGYVPPPLNGIWARWPYMHNNSMPTLCDVLLPKAERQVTYWAGPPKNKQTDFDLECNGYPSGAAVPSAWKQNRDYYFDTRRIGMKNIGHDVGIFVRNGRSIFSDQDRRDLIRFLQTL